ncbi:cupin domain-containing protein [Sporosarcina sp. UB5]|uniref:cupin domain-containing protein n=1 Tax=Sporosarcina sp. UB5 TaxID=3047463 RepID=UPI003D792A9F
MYYVPNMCQCHNPYCNNRPMFHYGGQSGYWASPVMTQNPNFRSSDGEAGILLKDYGDDPFVVNINEATKQNNTYRTALWTGDNLQLTLMSLNVGEDIGLEMHPDVEQFIRVEQGQGIVRMGPSRDNLNFERNVYDDSAILVPAGTWHNVINTGAIPLKVYTIYAPPNHPYGTVHKTKADAMAAEEEHGHRTSYYYR